MSKEPIIGPSTLRRLQLNGGIFETTAIGSRHAPQVEALETSCAMPSARQPPYIPSHGDHAAAKRDQSD